MTPPTPQQAFSRGFLIVLAIALSILFYQIVSGFLVTVLLAGIFSAMAQPMYQWFVRLFRGRRSPASGATIFIVLTAIIVPLAGFLSIVVAQGISVTNSAVPWVERQMGQPDQLTRLLERLPFWEQVAPYSDLVAGKVAELAGVVGNFLVNSVAALTFGTVTFLLHLFILLYAMFFFLIDGRKILDRILYYMPLTSEQEHQMVGRFVSVTRATIKGSLVIGIVQGGLAGLGFAVAGVPQAAFWGTVMAVLSIIPGLGTALVWIPGVIFLVATGHVIAGVLLAVWSIGIVGTVDNVLRPRLVGRDTKMSDLLILLSTLGGIFAFGAVGVIIGPIVAALFVTVWELYGEAFKEYLPAVRPTSSDAIPAGIVGKV